MNTKKNKHGSRPCDLLPVIFMEVMPIAKKNPIVSVTFSYVGKDSDFETFLKTIVRDYLAVDDPAAIPEDGFVDKVESDAA